MESLRGKLLIASPAMPDWFRRSVILMIEHAEEGAFGLVLNRSSESTVGEVVPDLAEIAGADEVIRVGGPVAPEGVVALGEFERGDEPARFVLASLGLVDLEDPPDSVGRLRLFAGHAGWGPGQLEAELEAEAWIVSEAAPEDVFADSEDSDLWAKVLRRMGGEYELLAMMPAEPSLN